MKNVFISGIARSGKSTLSKRLREAGDYNYIPLDYFTSSLKRNFKEIGITSSVVIDADSSKKLALLLSRVVEIIDTTNENYLIDSAHILPEDIVKYLNRDKWDIYYCGYPSITAQKKLENIRKYDTENDWTFNKSDDELLDILEKLIQLSGYIKDKCKELDVPFIDTSKDISSEIEKLLPRK